jgi:hypothetical protein
VFKVCERLKKLIFCKDLILPQLRESAKIRAQSYFLGAYRPCFIIVIILAFLPNFPSRKADFLKSRHNIISTYRRHAWADFKFRFNTFIMRLCFFCLRANTFYVVFILFSRYKQCVWHNRQYKLASLMD